MTFGKKLKQARTFKKLTQKELAEKINAKHNSVSNWENDQNKPDPDTIELICGVLDITPNYLLGGVESCFSFTEKEMIRKYRKLDDYGQNMVDMVLSNEYTRCNDVKSKAKLTKSITEPTYNNITTIAAHNDHLDDDGEMERMQQDLDEMDEWED